MKIGEQIRELRKKAKMTQDDLASVLNVTPQAVSQWEHDVTVPSTDKLAKLAAVLHTTVNVLTGESSVDPEWTMLDSLFSTDHMYSRVKIFAEQEQPCLFADDQPQPSRFPPTTPQGQVPDSLPFSVASGQSIVLSS